ncbi:MAG: hypothetical protein ACXWLR_01775 [Myxococcales bacterium]
MRAGDLELADEIVTVPIRPGMTQSCLLLTASTAPDAVALLFPGSQGLIRLPADVNDLALGSSFLVRSRDRFRDARLAVALVDAPSDRQDSGMDDAFRAGPAHREDVTAMIAALRRRFPAAKVVLVGTSRGTVSAAHLGRALGKAIDGVVLTSTVFEANRRDPGLSDFDFASIAAPLLFVHHAADGCPVSPYAPAEEQGKLHPLITVTGGLAARSGPCEALSAHGYYGKEAETVAAIKAWIFGEHYSNRIE